MSQYRKWTWQEAMAEVVLAQEKNLRTGILFGPERTGLDNDEMVFAEARVFIPLAEGATSLNLAQAVLLTCWEWLQAQHAAEAIPHTTPATEGNSRGEGRESPARREVLDGFLTPIRNRANRRRLLSANRNSRDNAPQPAGFLCP